MRRLLAALTLCLPLLCPVALPVAQEVSPRRMPISGYPQYPHQPQGRDGGFTACKVYRPPVK